MINDFIIFIMNMFNYIIQIVLTPIDSVLSVIIPSYAEISSNVVTFFNYIYNNIIFVLDWVHIPSSLVTIIIGYITFRVILYFSTLSFKLFIKWYNYLKL